MLISLLTTYRSKLTVLKRLVPSGATTWSGSFAFCFEPSLMIADRTRSHHAFSAQRTAHGGAHGNLVQVRNSSYFTELRCIVDLASNRTLAEVIPLHVGAQNRSQYCHALLSFSWPLTLINLQ